MKDEDQGQRFLFEDLAIRGELVHLETSYNELLARHDYPEKIQTALGKFVTAVTLLSSTLKFEGSLILQAESDGQVKMMMAECKNNESIRGIAQYDERNFDPNKTLFENARMALTLEHRYGKPYQSFIAMHEDDIIKGLEAYFEKSEQIKTTIHLAAEGGRAAGMLVQAMPLSDSQGSMEIDYDGYNRVQSLFRTLNDDELLNLSNHDVLTRLFHEEKIRVFDPKPIHFECGCSRERSDAAIKSLGSEDAKTLLEERGGEITVDCQFCREVYHFDGNDIIELFREELN